MANTKPLIETYREYLPVTSGTPIVSLGEGFTPLVHAPTISDRVGCPVYLKLEGSNPTGSFKDRGMTMAVSKAKEKEVEAVICASTGNTAASAASYASRAGMRCLIVLPEGKVALGKLAHLLACGAEVVPIQGNFDEALDIVRYLVEHYELELVNSINPFRIEGQTTGAYEIVDALGDSPTYHALPVGNAGNITAYWQGYRRYHEAGEAQTLPIMLGFQAAGAAPIVDGAPVEKPETIATAIRIGNPASWQAAVRARDESSGLIDKVSDKDILKAYQLLASQEGIYCEPASAASVAGILKLAQRNFFKPDVSVVCTLTGHGLKDPDTAVSLSAVPQSVAADAATIARQVDLVPRKPDAAD